MSSWASKIKLLCKHHVTSRDITCQQASLKLLGSALLCRSPGTPPLSICQFNQSICYYWIDLLGKIRPLD